MKRYEVRTQWKVAPSNSLRSFDNQQEAIEFARAIFKDWNKAEGFDGVQVLEIIETDIDWQ